MAKTVAQAEAALAAANAAFISELEADCNRSEGSGAQEARRAKYQQGLQDDIARCERELEEAKRGSPPAALPMNRKYYRRRLARPYRPAAGELERYSQ